MRVIIDFLTKNKFSRPGTLLKSVQGIVIHWVANPKTTAKNTRDYFESLKTQDPEKKDARYASAHFCIGLQGEILQCLPEGEVGYHVGAVTYTPLALEKLGTYPNSTTIGIELCHPEWDGSFTAETTEAALELTADLLNRYNLTKDDVYRHFDVTGKDCPRWYVQNESEWQKFLENF